MTTDDASSGMFQSLRDFIQQSRNNMPYLSQSCGKELFLLWCEKKAKSTIDRDDLGYRCSGLDEESFEKIFSLAWKLTKPPNFQSN